MNQLEKDNNLKVDTELISLSYANLSASISASAIIAIVLAVGIWSISNIFLLSIWLIAILGISFLRYLNAKQYFKKRSKYSIKRWKDRFYRGLLANALLWTVFIVYFFPQDDIVHKFFVAIMIIGLASGAVSSLSAYKQHIYTFLIALLLPLSLMMLLEGQFLFIMMSGVIILYVVMLIAMAARFNDNLIQAIKNKILFTESEQNLKRSEDHILKIFQQAPVGIFSFDKELKIMDLNQELADILHVDLEKLKGFDLHQISNDKIIECAEDVFKGEDTAYEGAYTSFYEKLELWISIKATPIFNSNNEVESGLAIFQDITDKKLSEDRIRYLAYHDELTGLPNRSLLYDRLDYLIARVERNNVYSALMFIDLDHFKTINDSLGHHIGDELLKMFTQRVEGVIRQDDTLSRLGGDEFIILLSELSAHQFVAINMALGIANKVHEATKDVYTFESHSLHISASIGVTLIDELSSDKNDILKFADLAMYKAKEEGRNRTCFYEEQMDVAIRKRLHLENDLHEALKNREFQLYYQPIVDCKSDDIVCVEALLRYCKKDGTIIYPDEFIPIAEESGMIVPIGYWVIEEACKQFVSWKKEYKNSKLENIAINISQKQFMQEDFVSKLTTIVSRYKIEYKTIELELTESVVIGNVTDAIEKMNILKELGFTLSMDDFGTGYSSLSYLKNLPFDIIKIDKSFMQNILINSDDALLVSAILNISEQFNLKVIAEGIETVEHIEFLKASSCDFYQGYVVSRPVAAEHFERFLK